MFYALLDFREWWLQIGNVRCSWHCCGWRGIIRSERKSVFKLGKNFSLAQEHSSIVVSWIIRDVHRSFVSGPAALLWTILKANQSSRSALSKYRSESGNILHHILQFLWKSGKIGSIKVNSCTKCVFLILIFGKKNLLELT